MTTAEILAINVPFMVLFFALWVGIPMWMITRRPDRHPRETRTVPAYLRQRPPAGQHARRRGAVRLGAQRRELAWASRS
jgi:hypothetical protein